MPTLSNELQSVEWTDGAERPRVGARFVGYNEPRAFGKWSTTSQIVAHDEPREFAWAVGDSENPAATWRFRLAPRDGGTVADLLDADGTGTTGLPLANRRDAPTTNQGSYSYDCGSSRPRLKTRAAIKRLAEHGVR
jgi:hypothetical protein